jgi:hypothetical protein
MGVSLALQGETRCRVAAGAKGARRCAPVGAAERS